MPRRERFGLTLSHSGRWISLGKLARNELSRLCAPRATRRSTTSLLAQRGRRMRPCKFCAHKLPSLGAPMVLSSHVKPPISLGGILLNSIAEIKNIERTSCSANLLYGIPDGLGEPAIQAYVQREPIKLFVFILQPVLANDCPCAFRNVGYVA